MWNQIDALEIGGNVNTNDLGPDYWAVIWGTLAALDMDSLESLGERIQYVFIPNLREKVERSELRRLRLKMEDGATGSGVLEGLTTMCSCCIL